MQWTAIKSHEIKTPYTPQKDKKWKASRLTKNQFYARKNSA
ncbi:hypothetical protein P20480_2174 [Pseudoalteromonas sp. BSi20480]|nr:hypothetical protein P20480_2174 [Pseudoalteromonas sp. BSi20480]